MLRKRGLEHFPYEDKNARPIIVTCPEQLYRYWWASHRKITCYWRCGQLQKMWQKRRRSHYTTPPPIHTSLEPKWRYQDVSNVLERTWPPSVYERIFRLGIWPLSKYTLIVWTCNNQVAASVSHQWKRWFCCFSNRATAKNWTERKLENKRVVRPQS